MNEVNNISRSFADNVNYLAELDKQYYTDGFIKRNGIQLGTQEYFGKVTMNVFDKSQKKHIVSDIISGSIVGNSGLEQFLLDMKTSIETLYNDVVVNVVVSNGTGAIADKNINITLSSTDTIMGLIQIDVSMYTNPGVVADYTKYSILSASNEYIAILPYLSTLDNDFNNSILSIGELSSEIKIVSDNSANITSVASTVVPNINEILLADTRAEEAASSSLSASISSANALSSEIKAEKWASESEDVEVETGEYSAKHWALKSKKLSVGVASNMSYDNAESGLSSSNVQDAIDELDNNLDNLSANVYTKSEINSSLATKVDKVIGKQLSTEDFTTAEKNKLIGIAIGANNYTLPAATSTAKGGVELYSDTVQTVASNAVTNAASRTYGLQFNSAGQAVVNVPWVDTNTVYTHPVSGATAGTYKSVTVDINGHVTSGTNPTTIGGFGITDAYTKTQTQETLPAVGFDTSNTTPPTRVGQMKWNENEGTVDLAVYNAVIQIGQEFVVNVRNNTGSAITNGTVVIATGSIGNSGRITVAPHDGTMANAVNILGVTTQDITNGSDGTVTIIGKVRSLNTTGSTVGETWADGTKLYVKPNDGGRLTSIEPGDFETKMSVAYVVHAHTNGTLYIRTLGFDENNYKIWVQNKLDLKANIVSPTFTGVPAVPTAAIGTNTTQVASTAYVIAEINKIEEW